MNNIKKDVEDNPPADLSLCPQPYSVSSAQTLAPRHVRQAEHGVSFSNISDNAIKVLRRLKSAGYQAYLVGGGVRDLLLDLQPKDFDVVTDAQPGQIRELFKNCRLIGRRFRLAHVRFGREIIEVSTFRAAPDNATEGKRIIRDNIYGRSLDDDARRRDFTVNALYLDVENGSIIDHVGGIQDIKDRQLRLIGIPETRYREDPVRMLRAVRLASKLDFSIHPGSRQLIRELAPLLQGIPPARLFEECLKIFSGGNSLQAYGNLREYRLFGWLFPQIDEILNQGEEWPHTLLRAAFASTDLRLAEAKPVTPAFLIAALLWTPVKYLTEKHEANGLSAAEAMELAGDAVISHQRRRLSIPRRLTTITREIWALQSYFNNRRRKWALKLLVHPRFRAAYDFLLLRAEAGDIDRESADWWCKFQSTNMDLQVAAKKKRQRSRKYYIRS